MNRMLIHRRVQRVLPAGIETCGLLHFGTAPGQVEATLLASSFGIAACGVVVLRLASATALAIQRQGLEFFERANASRGAMADALPVRYGRWRQASLAMASRAGFAGCGVGYFVRAKKGCRWLAVFPVERLVVFGWRR